MRILITNDDGINSEGISILARWAKNLGDVTLVAPKRQQSGKSHSIELHQAFEVVETKPVEGCRAFSVDSSPADCIRFAMTGLDINPDIVFTGINQGFNVGHDIAYSGTCGSLFEAGYFKIPSVAFSTDPDTFEGALSGLDKAWKFIEDFELLKQSTMLNVNIPIKAKGIRVTQQGGPFFLDKFKETEKDHYLAYGFTVWKDTKNFSLDTDSVFNGWISVTPMSNNRTDFDSFEKLKHSISQF